MAQATQPRSIADRLVLARDARLVGRRDELELLDGALRTPESPFAVLYIHGPGGVGKSALLHAFADRCRAAGARPLVIDGRDIEPSPRGFLAACGLDSKATGRALEPPLPSHQRGERLVVLVDTYERLEPIDAWLRQSLVPQLPVDAIVVIAGRRPPSRGWRSDPAWSALMHVVRLANLPPEDARQYLDVAGVCGTLHDEIVAVTGGHPLTLSLLIDVLDHCSGGTDLAVFHAPDVMRRLLEHFVEDLPTPAHRVALDTCALVRATTHRHLRATLQREDVDELFDWLRQLSFVQEGPRGLVPHDLARDVLAADVRWRDPGRYRALMVTLTRIAGDEMRRAPGGDPPRQAVLDLLYTFRTHPTLSRYCDFAKLGELRPEPPAAADRDAVVRMVGDNDGPANADLAAAWFARQPDAFRINRDHEGHIESVVGWLDLTAATNADITADPVARAAWDYVRAHHPPSPNEVVSLARFGSPTVDPTRRPMLAALSLYECLRRAVTQPNLTVDVLTTLHPDWWGPLFSRFGYERLPGDDVEVDGRPYALFAHDWRRLPAPFSLILDDRDWHRIRARLSPSPAELSRPEFEAAVRQALRDLHRPDALARNPLTRTRLMSGKGGGGGDGEGSGGDEDDDDARLAGLLAEAAQTLTGHPRDEKLHRALDRTYFRPAPTQEKAAELLGLPLSTYRRHLSHSITRLTDWLWSRCQ
jgi:hypothetical protein